MNRPTPYCLKLINLYLLIIGVLISINCNRFTHLVQFIIQKYKIQMNTELKIFTQVHYQN